jgi:tetratricopeptide (TPR) repeat protein
MMSSSADQQVDRLSRQYAQLLQAERYQEAREVAVRARALAAEGFGRQSVEYGTSLLRLAEILTRLDDRRGAEPLLLEALAIARRQYGNRDPNTAVSLANLGDLYSGMDDPVRAEPYYRGAVDVWAKTVGPDDPQYLRSLEDLGGVYYETKAYAKAVPILERVIGLRRAKADDDERLAHHLFLLADIHHRRGEPAKAAGLFRDLLAIKRRRLSPRDPALARVLNALAEQYRRLEDEPAAEALLLEASGILRPSRQPEDQAFLAHVLNNLANLYYLSGRFTDAEPPLREVLALRRARLGRHPEVAFCLNNLGALCNKLGKRGDAETMYREAIGILRESDPESLLPSVLTNLASLQRATSSR